MYKYGEFESLSLTYSGGLPCGSWCVAALVRSEFSMAIAACKLWCDRTISLEGAEATVCKLLIKWQQQLVYEQTV